MTPPPPPEPFRFETSYDTSAVRPEHSPTQRSKLGLTEDQFFVVFALLGIACLFWRYTVSLGVATLFVMTFFWTMRERSRERRKHFSHLEEPPTMLHLLVTDEGYGIRGDDFQAESSWSRVINGFEMNGYLLIQSWRMPRVYLPIAELKERGVYDRVRAIVDARSAEWEAARAEARAATARAG
jgi:hypothetical protein